MFPDKTAKICDFGLARGEIDDNMEVRVPREQTMLKGHLPRVIYHQVY